MVSSTQPPLHDRRGWVKALPAFLCFVLLGVLALWLALSALLPSMHAIMTHASLVALSPRDMIGLPLALLCFALAAMTLLPGPESGSGQARGGRRSSDRRRKTGLTLCLGAAIAGVLLTVVTVPLTEIAASAIMGNRHYLRCPAPLRERHPPLRWVLPDWHCP